MPARTLDAPVRPGHTLPAGGITIATIITTATTGHGWAFARE